MSTAGLTGFYTEEISAAVTINKDDYVVFFSVLCLTGTLQIIGGGRTFQGKQPSVITLQPGQGYSLEASNQSANVFGVTITPVAGTAALTIQ